MEKETILTVENLSVSFGDQNVLENVNFSIAKGDVLAVIGPNGSGKSVLFRALLDLVPYTGKISWQKNIRLGYVPQKAFIEREFPLTVKEFLSLKSSSKHEMSQALSAVGLAGHSRGSDPHNPNEHHLEHHVLKRRIGVLSGGEFQRVLIAWSLMGHPNVLLFDEPTSGIDIGGEETIYNILHELQEKHDLTVILISHDLNVVYKYADNVMCLNREQVCFGEPHSVLNPQELASIYGGETKFYKHQHSTHEHI